MEPLGFPQLYELAADYALREDLAHFRKVGIFQIASQADALEETQSIDPIAGVH